MRPSRAGLYLVAIQAFTDVALSLIILHAQIEPDTIADLPAIEAFIAALHDTERELMPILSPGAELAAAGVRQMLQDISADKGTALLAKSEGRPIGFGCALFNDYRDRDPSHVEGERRSADMVMCSARTSSIARRDISTSMGFVCR